MSNVRDLVDACLSFGGGCHCMAVISNYVHNDVIFPTSLEGNKEHD